MLVRVIIILLGLLFSFTNILAADTGKPEEIISPAELQALDRAIAREINTGNINSQMVNLLTNLRKKLVEYKKTPPANLSNVEDISNLLLIDLEKKIAQGDKSLLKKIVLYYLYLGEYEKALAQCIKNGPQSEYDISYYLLLAFLNLSLGEHKVTLTNVLKAEKLLESRMNLEVSNLTFCYNVSGYRLYTPLESTDFTAGEDLLVYLEISGASFVENEAKQMECNLKFSLKLKDDEQKIILSEPNYGIYDPSFMGIIKDLHAVISFRIPNNTLPGRYHLFVEVLEPLTNRRGEAVIAFNVKNKTANTGELNKGLYNNPYIPGLPIMPNTGGGGLLSNPLGDKEAMDMQQKYMMDILKRNLERQKVN